MFDLNKVEGHVEYKYINLLERIENIMADKNRDIEEEKEQKSEDPITRHLGSTKTTWQNFYSISQQIKREPQHILDYFKAELDVEGNFGSENNLILVGKYQNKNITNLYKQYLGLYVRCIDCKKLNTELTRDSSTRLQNLECKDCGATRTVQNIKKGFHAVRRGERRAARNK